MKSFPPVSLRAMEPEDLDTLYTLENDRTVWGVSATNVPYSRSVLIDYITSSKSDVYADGQVRLMVDNEEGETVGTVDLTNFDPKHRRAELGIAIKTSHGPSCVVRSIARIPSRPKTFAIS